MIEKDFFDNILNLFYYTQHPEKTHYEQNRHPGESWVLKTVIPDPTQPEVDKYQIGHQWCNFANTHPHLVRVTQIAYDWDKNPIPNAWSIWVTQDMDVYSFLQDDGRTLAFTPVERATSDRVFAENVLKIVNLIRVQYDLDTVAEDDISIAEETAHKISEHNTKSEHEKLRDQFKVITNESNTSNT